MRLWEINKHSRHLIYSLKIKSYLCVRGGYHSPSPSILILYRHNKILKIINKFEKLDQSIQKNLDKKSHAEINGFDQF